MLQEGLVAAWRKLGTGMGCSGNLFGQSTTRLAAGVSSSSSFAVRCSLDLSLVLATFKYFILELFTCAIVLL